MHMDQITNILPGIIAIHDDMFIWENKRRTDTHLLPLMKTASKNGLVFTVINAVLDNHK